MKSEKGGHAREKKLLEGRLGEKFMMSCVWINKLYEGLPVKLNENES